MAEVWRKVRALRRKAIPAGLFEASDAGRVRTLPRTLTDGRAIGGVGLLPDADEDGYLWVKGGGMRVAVATLVCLAFHGPPEVRHLNGNRQDNRPGNLAWGSHKDNERDKRKQKLEERDDGTPPYLVGTGLGQ
jgi:hypothetical protein